jgi:hypothetical protein
VVFAGCNFPIARAPRSTRRVSGTTGSSSSTTPSQASMTAGAWRWRISACRSSRPTRWPPRWGLGRRVTTRHTRRIRLFPFISMRERDDGKRVRPSTELSPIGQITVFEQGNAPPASSYWRLAGASPWGLERFQMPA